MRTLKLVILIMDSGLEEKKRVLFVEILHDLMLYQINEKDKIDFLTKEQNRSLSELQENIEDYVGKIFAKSNIELNRGMALKEIKDFLKKV